MIHTVIDNLKDSGDGLYEGVKKLFGDQNIHFRDLNTPYDNVFILGASYEFPELSLESKRLQSKLINDLHVFHSLCNVLIKKQPDQVKEKLESNFQIVREAIEQNLLTYFSSTTKIVGAVKNAIDEIIFEISYFYSPSEDSFIIVPDTNILLKDSSFQNWKFDGINKFEIVLIPMLLSELDSIKMDHRNPDVRAKAQTIVKQIKEYRRRGSLLTGVIIIKDKITLKTIALEPKMEESLPWLDNNSPDDRMLAAFIEVMRTHTRSKVVLVTRDINLQNKAEFAGLYFIEPYDD